MKTISILIPTCNEENNIVPLYNRIKNIFENINYNYEIIFIDNLSLDNTRSIIINLSIQDKNVKAIFNAKNFGFVRSSYYGLIQTTGDATVLLYADLQEPPEVILDFIKEWENGHKIVIGKKVKSRENFILSSIIQYYYKIIKSISYVEQIENFHGFGLYDKSFIEILKKLNDPEPYLRGIVSELGFSIAIVLYNHNKRYSGKSKFNFYKMYDLAMLGITSYSKVPLRIATICGFICSGISFSFGIIYFIYKLLFWNSFSVGIAPLVIGVFFIGSIQLFFIGLLGEYILNINSRTMNRPLVIEERRINF